jgi:hypothetical protein
MKKKMPLPQTTNDKRTHHHHRRLPLLAPGTGNVLATEKIGP